MRRLWLIKSEKGYIGSPTLERLIWVDDRNDATKFLSVIDAHNRKQLIAKRFDVQCELEAYEI